MYESRLLKTLQVIVQFVIMCVIKSFFLLNNSSIITIHDMYENKAVHDISSRKKRNSVIITLLFRFYAKCSFQFYNILLYQSYWMLTSAQFTKCSCVPYPIPHFPFSHPQLLPALYHHCKTHLVHFKALGNFNCI